MKAVVFAYHEMGCVGIEALLRQGFEIPFVVTHADDPVETVWFRSVAELAASHGIPVFAPADPNHPLWVERCRRAAPDFLFSFYYRKLLKRELLVYILPLGLPPLVSPDETRYAEIPREMLVSGDWVVPRLDGMRYFEKPPLGYWLTALSMSALGQNRFALRLPSALAVGLTAVILLMLGTRLVGRRAGLLSVAAYLSSLLVFVVGSINLLDSVFALFVTGTFAGLLLAVLEQDRGRRRALLVLCGVSGGLAFLTKGFLAWALPGIVVLPFLMREGRLRELGRFAWIPAIVALLIVSPWSVWIAFREPDFWHYFLWVEHVDRFFRPVGPSQHPEPFWKLLPALVGSTLAWLPLVPAAISGHRDSSRLRVAQRFLLLWLLLPLVFFSISRGKLATYLLPCVPPLALLLGIGLDGYAARGRFDRFRLGAFGSAAMAVGALALLASSGRERFGADETWKWVLWLAGITCWGLLALLAACDPNDRRRLWIYSAAPILALFCIHSWMPRAALESRALTSFLQDHASRLTSGARVVGDSKTIHALCWELKRDDIYLFDQPGELEYGARSPEAAHRLLSPTGLGALPADGSPMDTVLVLAEWRHGALLRDSLAGSALGIPAFRASGSGLVLVVYPPVPIPSSRALD